jgi:hypothetical protein
MTPKLWTRRSLLLALASAGLAAPACDFSQVFSWNGGKPTIFGYRTAPNFDRRYKTIRVKIFKDATLWAAVPVPGLEDELAETIVHHIEQMTPYKVSDNDPDLELSGRILDFMQVSLNYNQLNEIREVETTLTCAIRLKDMRTGQLLSSPSPNIVEPMPPAGLLPGMQDPLNGPGAMMPGSVSQMELSAAPVGPLMNNQGTMMGNQDNGANGQIPPPNTGNPSFGQTNAPGPSGGPPVAPLPTGGYNGGVLVRSLAYYRPEIGESLATAQQTNCQRMAEQIVNMMEMAW